MANAYLWSFGLSQAPDLEKLKSVLHAAGSSTLIQTSDGVCIKSPRSAPELAQLFEARGLPSPQLKAIEPSPDLPPDVRAFISESA